MQAQRPSTDVQPKFTIDRGNARYVIKGSTGMSCWGFENALRETQALALALQSFPDRGREKIVPLPDVALGTMAVIEEHAWLLEALKRSGRQLGTWFNPATPAAVRVAMARSTNSSKTMAGGIAEGRDMCSSNMATHSIKTI